MAEIDLTLIDRVAEEAKRIDGIVAGLVPQPSLPSPQNVYSNFSLLLKTVGKFHRKNKNAPYLPASITTGISTQLTQISTEIAAILIGADEPVAETTIAAVVAILQKADALYAFCLQYGLISFGFSTKVAQEHVNAIMGSVADVETAKADTERKIDAAFTTLVNKLDGVSAAAADRAAAIERDLSTKLESITTQVTSIETQVTIVKSAAGTATTLVEATQKSATDSARMQGEVNTLLTAVTSQTATAVADTRTILGAAQAAEKQAGEFSASAKALVQGVTDAKAAIEAQLKNITAFYAEIEKYKQDMVEARKTANADAALLQNVMEARANSFGQRTEKIAKENEELNRQIKEHLGKAVGIGLFKAFENRRTNLLRVAIGWAVALLVTIVGAVWLGFLLASSFGTHDLNVKVFIARLLVAFPVGFLIVFVAKQYSRERRAEEEYAFKSAISVSLDAYRGLIEKMRKDGDGAETEFVKELIRDVFDNPTKRLYPAQDHLRPEKTDESEDSGRG